MEGSDPAAGEKPARPRIRIHFPGAVAACGSFAIQYNYGCAGVAVAVMTSHRDVTGVGVEADYPEPKWAEQLLLSNVFVGSVIGMLVMGYLGDVVGVRVALVLTNALTVAGALVSSLFSWGAADTVWTVIAVSRFVLGVGVGGLYPLTAARAAQSTPTPAEATAKAAGAFLWQGPGACAPYVVLMLLLQLPPTESVTSWQFRILLGMGAIPAMAVLLASLFEIFDNPHSASLGAANPAVHGSSLRSDVNQEKHWKTLVGTGGAWFLFDVAIYGFVIFQPTILSSISGDSQTLMDIGMRGAFMFVVGTAGLMVGVMAVEFMGPKMLAIAGFKVAAMVFFAFALVFRFMPDCHSVLFALLCLINFAMQAGPAVATYVLPVYVFPQNVRSTFHGMSAVAGKVGAMVGTAFFPSLNEALGMDGVMTVEAVVCLIGICLSSWCIAEQQPCMSGLSMSYNACGGYRATDVEGSGPTPRPGKA